MNRYIIIFFFIALFLLTSCGLISDLRAGMAIDGKTIPFEKKEDDTAYAAIENRLKALMNISVERGWPEPWVPGGVVMETAGELGYEVIYSEGDDKMKTRAFWSIKDKDSFIHTLQEKKISFIEEPIYHCRPYLNKKSPLPGAALEWSDTQLGEWLCWEWAAEEIGTNTPRKLSGVSFIAWKFNETVITQLLGPGSLELTYWKETIRDRRTFQVLVKDLRSQVRAILDSNPESEERDKTLQRIEKNWFVSYRQEYKNRFLTNLYKNFGNSGWVDPLALFLIGEETIGWSEWESRAPQVITNGRELLEVVKGK
jgi:hypothetical protein